MGYTTAGVVPHFFYTKDLLRERGETFMKVNGKIVALEEPVSLKDFLQGENYDLSRVAVELNGQIVPKASYGEVMLSSEATLEIVSFVGGG